MYRVPVFHRPSAAQKSKTSRIDILGLVVALSALCGLVSLGLLMASYIKPASFAATLNGANSDPSTFTWIPHFPLLVSLGVLALLARFMIMATMHHGQRARASRLAKGFEVGLFDVPFLAAFLIVGLVYLHPIASGFSSQIQGGESSPVQFGCAVSRLILSVLSISHLGHALYGGWGIWKRGWMR
ncbi:MAG TPA: hypothetical protein VFW40_01600 [Capsulimonadaceae bacterium]|nr:hypothetical protein [Capsulimonadaceae bacterium]